MTEHSMVTPDPIEGKQIVSYEVVLNPKACGLLRGADATV
jgi:hypothetical protein